MIVRTSALTVALFGARSMHVRAAGCYPSWGSGGSYNSGSVVSNTETKSTTSSESCTGTSNGCSGGYRTVTTTTTTSTNYVCVNNANSAFCGSYQPGSHGGSIAWSSTGTCDGDAPAPVIPTPSPWGKGCPGAFVAGSDYAAADVVSVSMGTHTEVFECAGEPMNLFCGQSGYEPATGQYYQGVWTSKGSCSGTMAPTDSPSFDTLEDAGGCPGAYSEGEAYDEGDKVSLDGFVYECNPNPNGLFCSNAAYAPGVDIPGGAVTPYWKTAWSIKGYCDGTITPTVSPSFDSLQNLGGCPPEWELKVHPEEYEEGQTAAVGELVFRCKTYPASGWCGQAGYKPMDETAGHQDAWKNAWQLAGYCDGSMGPTVSPSFDPENVIGACPDEWVAKVHPLKYEEGEMVAVTVSEDPERKYAYRCKAFPFDGYCGQFAPDVWGGQQGWTLAGACDGSIGPTASPVFVSLNIIGDGCPEEFDLSKMDYAYGDQVSVAANADQKIVYECKSWPLGDHCKSDADNIRDPTAEFGDMGWILKGGCEGTIAPTPAPVPYAGACSYTKTVVTTNCSPGSSGCSCTTDSAPGTYCTKTEFTTTEVDNYSAGTSYDTGDVVRINGDQRYKCKVAGWCSMESYKPDGVYGGHAWSPDGKCM